MRPRLVVVPDVLTQNTAEAPLVQRDYVVEALVADRADDPLGERVRLRRPDRSQHRLEPDRAYPGDEATAVAPIPIKAPGRIEYLCPTGAVRIVGELRALGLEVSASTAY